MAALAAADLLAPRVLRSREARFLVLAGAAAGVVFSFATADVDRIGGIILSVLLTMITTAASFPLGILLALGRRSRHRFVRVTCTTYIEFLRSLPLLLVVYLIWLSVPLIVPHWQLTGIARAGVAFSLFVSVYLAEYVRTGLQAVPAGQVEAAQSLGLETFDINRFIVVPQAIRTVLPALVGNVLEIFNAVPLLFIIGSVDLLRAGQIILSNPQYGGKSMEMFSFIFMIYLAIGSLLTFASRKLERRMHASR